MKDELNDKSKGHIGLASMILGIIGVFFVPIVFSILAMIFGGVAMNQKQRFGTAGLVLGIIGFVIWAIVFSVVLLFLGMRGGFF